MFYCLDHLRSCCEAQSCVSLYDVSFTTATYRLQYTLNCLRCACSKRSYPWTAEARFFTARWWRFLNVGRSRRHQASKGEDPVGPYYHGYSPGVDRRFLRRCLGYRCRSRGKIRHLVTYTHLPYHHHRHNLNFLGFPLFKTNSIYSK